MHISPIINTIKKFIYIFSEACCDPHIGHYYLGGNESKNIHHLKLYLYINVCIIGVHS